MYSPITKSFKQKHKLNSSLNKSLNNSLSQSRNSQRRKTAIFPTNNQSFFGSNKSKPVLNSSTREATEQDESCFQIVDFDGHVPNSVTNVIMDCDACMHLKLQVTEQGVALLSTLECLHVWNFVSKKKCYELPLPYMGSSSAFDESSSFLQAALFIPDNGDVDMDSISCVAVTTSGFVFYWRSIAYSRSFVEIQISPGQGESDVCVDVVAVGEGFVVGWMSGALSHLLPHQGTLRSSPLRQHQGASLSTIGRRVSNLFFGSSQNDPSQNSGALRKLLVGKGEEGGWRLVVMCESFLQLWSAERMHYHVDLLQMVKTHMQMQGSQEAYSDVCLQDIQLAGASDHLCDELVVLVTTNDNKAVTHHIVFLDGSRGTPVIRKLLNTTFTTLIMYNGSFKTFKLLKPNCSDTLLCSLDSVLCARGLESREEDEEEEEEEVRMDVFRQMNVGGGVYKGQALLLSNQATLLSIRQSEALMQSNVADSLLKSRVFSSVDERKSRSNMEASEGGDLLTRFKRAFISSMIHNEQKSQPNDTLINELLSPSNDNINNSTINNSPLLQQQQQQQLQLDNVVVRLSRDMIDDHPSSHTDLATSSFTTSVILSHQLDDKSNSHHLLIHFLNKHHLCNKLTWIRDEGGYQATTEVLYQHAEKLATIVAVKQLYDENIPLLERAIDRCMRSRQGTSHDHFFRQVSRVHELIGHMVEEEESQLDSSALLEGNVDVVVQSSRVIEVMLDTAAEYRSSYNHSLLPPPPPHVTSSLRVARPWTSSSSLLVALHKHHSLIHSQVIPSLSQESPLKEQLFQALFRLTEHMLSGMSAYIGVLESFGVESHKLMEFVNKYEQTRANLIQPFVKEGQTNRAISLAETFRHFDLLVQLNCSDQHKLIKLMQQYEAQDFPEAVFNWFCKNGKSHQLLTPPLLHHPHLQAFITRPQHKPLSWLYYASKHLYPQAFDILYELAMDKNDNLAEKMSLLSYAKLYARLCPEQHEVAQRLQELDVCLDLMERQVMLFNNRRILEKFEIKNAKDARVCTPMELIELHVEVGQKDEESLMLAFELVKFLDPEEHQVKDVIVDIWSAAILSDDLNAWRGDVHPTSPLSSLQHLTIFKLISLFIDQGAELMGLLPPLTSLLSHPSLLHHVRQASFEHKLRTLLEYAERSSAELS